MFNIAWLLLVFIPLLIDWKTTIKYFKESFNLYKQLRIKHLLLGLLSLISVLIISAILYNSFSIMRIGWLWSLVANNNDNKETASTDTSMMITIVSAVVIIFLYVILLTIIPSLAKQEEEMFRKKAIKKKFILCSGNKIKKDKTLIPLLYQVVFGLMHMIMGIPLAFACALIISGIIFYLTAKHSFIKYFNNHIENIKYNNDKEKVIQFVKTCWDAEEYAIKQSTLVHTAHNFVVISSIIVVMFIALV